MQSPGVDQEGGGGGGVLRLQPPLSDFLVTIA